MKQSIVGEGTDRDVDTGEPVFDLTTPDDDIPSAVALSHGEHRAVSATAGKVVSWDLDSGKLLRQFPIRGQVLSFHFGDDDERLRIATDLGVCVVEEADPACVEFPLPQIGTIVSASIQEEATLLGTRAGQIFVWNNAASKITRKWTAQRANREVFNIDFRAGAESRRIGVEIKRFACGTFAAVRPWRSSAASRSGPMRWRCRRMGSLH
ncbi:MAG TPA: hypothetical protein VK540_25640 [Polyangiaceae bacterium]|nr:hypothetical protein [Polyangiaceae bacterium]